MAFQCSIVTPERQVLNESIDQAILPAHDGLMGILTDRSPLLVKLGIGPLRIDLPNNQRRWFVVDGGVAQMKENQLTILTGSAQPAAEVDAEAAQAEYAEAVARRPANPDAAADRERQIQRARAKLTVASKA